MGNVIMEGDENAADDDWEWEYYYEEGEEDELRLSPTATTAPTTRATSPFPHEIQRANIVSPTTLWEEIFGPAITFRPPEIGLARESIHVDPNSMCDSMISVALAAEYLGHSAVDLAATLPPNFMQVSRLCPLPSLILFYKKMGQPWPLFHLFSVFSNKQNTKFTTN